VLIWFSKLANRLLGELDPPELEVPVADVPDDEFGLEEVGALPEKLMSTIVKLSAVIVVPAPTLVVVPEPPLTPLDADELPAEPSP
jgi:hypothetical protein